jgi:nitrogen regulatory protein PII
MRPVKRLEIIVDSPEVPEIEELLRREGASGYTVFSQLRGSGDRGQRYNDEPGGGDGNACVLVAVPVEDVMRYVEAIRPILRRRGGICLVSDAHWVLH